MWPWLSSLAGWFVRLIGGWLPIGTKPVSEWLGKLIFAVGTSALVFFLLTNFKGCSKKPSVNPQTTQDLSAGESIYNPTYNIQPHFGCASVQLAKDKK